MRDYLVPSLGLGMCILKNFKIYDSDRLTAVFVYLNYIYYQGTALLLTLQRGILAMPYAQSDGTTISFNLQGDRMSRRFQRFQWK
ncbi:hypothetical protein H6G41_24605 [Tolypothrix sp. FACHB-123]|uniref:hypothetical protein n=1 Tax=Tolypothrix sp. FACHB-123 TaxID=2692868 RepID=UPI00168494A4|nr:hypothetical protein [Tolypothrix sp. FACHB-123]MBD2357752.1 hypothetical protein [Tolypothrix sp. FACHB-123]